MHRTSLGIRLRQGISRRALGAASIAMLDARGALAQQSWPDRPVRIVAPFAPGGPADVIARTLAERLPQIWQQPVVVENRTGAGGNIGSEYVARMPPDGYTLLIAPSTIVTAPALMPRLPFDPIRDFTPIAQAASHPQILIVHASVQARTVAELVALARTQPVAYGSAGVGVSSHLLGALFAMVANVELTHVPFNGTAPAHAAVLGAQVQAVFQNPTLAVPAVRDGRVRALATTGTTRWRDLPDVPTFAELGYAGFEPVTWYGVLGPAGIPPGIVERAEAAILAALRAPETRSRLMAVGFDLPDRGAADFRAVMQDDLVKWGTLIRRAGITVN